MAYRRDRSGMSSLMKVRHKLRKAIDAEPVERKGESSCERGGGQLNSRLVIRPFLSGAVSQNVENDRKSSHDVS